MHPNFYTMVAKMFLEKFGYTPSTNESSTIDDENVDAAGGNDPALQTREEEWDNKYRNKIYNKLQEVSN